MSVQGFPPQMGQCSVTGKMVPEDELVTINGQRVCAEGKAILLERLRSGEAMPGEMEKPTILRRFGCIFLDGLIIGIPTAIIGGVVAASTGGSSTSAGLVNIVATLAQVVYFAQMHASRGQTVGKIAGKLKVVNLDGSPISTGTAYLRAFAYNGIGILTGVAILTGSGPFGGIAGIIVVVWGIANVIAALVDSKSQRALHDRIAGTRVVMKE